MDQWFSTCIKLSYEGRYISYSKRFPTILQHLSTHKKIEETQNYLGLTVHIAKKMRKNIHKI